MCTLDSGKKNSITECQGISASEIVVTVVEMNAQYSCGRNEQEMNAPNSCDFYLRKRLVVDL